ncbi:MAG: hypothetical protein H0T79_01975 [Deltaproteobacteria bacterium]|nr:hypothetical protein [Deltaproteobacteria bacterium]
MTRLPCVLALVAAVGCGFGDNQLSRVPTPACGDAVLDAGEGCDDGNLVSGDGCTANCAVETLQPECGNGTREEGEACDDGNAASGDGCGETCDVESVCGNGTREQGEACDDGNAASGDGCSGGPNARGAYTLADPTGDPLNVKVCSNACELVAQTGCPSATGCIAISNTGGDFTDCAVMGTVPDGGACASPLDCMPGATCVSDNGVASCREYCKMSAPACGTGESCVGFTSTLSIAGAIYGACI